MRLINRVAVITGGARGIGGGAAKVFAQEGAQVVIGDVLETEGNATVAAIREAGGEAVFVRCDVSKEDNCRALMGEAVERYGHLDVLACCAGIMRGSFVPVDELDESTFDSVIDVNLKGCFLCAKHAAPWMRKAKGGVIILIASGAGVRGASSSAAYGASKGGVHGLALTLEARLAPDGIRVHTVCPAAIDTVLLRQVKEVAAAPKLALPPGLGDPIGLARVLAFLASPDADYVRGTVFTR